MTASQPVHWSLRFGASLGFGVWCLELSLISQRARKPALRANPGSSSQCMASKFWGLSMNLPGHRIAAWLGKAALKTHALQTLRDGRSSPKRAKRLECVRFLSALSVGRGTARGSWFQCTVVRPRELHERGSAVVERNRFRADQVNATVDGGQINRRAARTEFAVKILPDGKMFFCLQAKIADYAPRQRIR